MALRLIDEPSPYLGSPQLKVDRLYLHRARRGEESSLKTRDGVDNGEGAELFPREKPVEETQCIEPLTVSRNFENGGV